MIDTQYTEAQLRAIECIDRPLQIIACAGSGKTQVISQRISNILAQPGVEPRNVVAFTFTEKAAAELKDRVLSIVADEHGDVTGLAEMYIGTWRGSWRSPGPAGREARPTVGGTHPARGSPGAARA